MSLAEIMAVIAEVADPVVVAITLVGVGYLGAVVDVVIDAVVVAVGGRRQRLAPVDRAKLGQVNAAPLLAHRLVAGPPGTLVSCGAGPLRGTTEVALLTQPSLVDHGPDAVASPGGTDAVTVGFAGAEVVAVVTGISDAITITVGLVGVGMVGAVVDVVIDAVVVAVGGAVVTGIAGVADAIAVGVGLCAVGHVGAVVDAVVDAVAVPVGVGGGGHVVAPSIVATEGSRAIDVDAGAVLRTLDGTHLDFDPFTDEGYTEIVGELAEDQHAPLEGGRADLDGLAAGAGVHGATRLVLGHATRLAIFAVDAILAIFAVDAILAIFAVDAILAIFAVDTVGSALAGLALDTVLAILAGRSLFALSSLSAIGTTVALGALLTTFDGTPRDKAKDHQQKDATHLDSPCGIRAALGALGGARLFLSTII